MVVYLVAAEPERWAAGSGEGGTPTEGKEYTISSRVFVGNLNYDTTQSELETMFSEVGQLVEVFLPADRISGRPRGFAFVEFTDATAAVEAIKRFNDKEFRGRSLRVTVAEERQQRPQWVAEEGPPHGHRRNDRLKTKGSRRGLRAKRRSLWGA